MPQPKKIIQTPPGKAADVNIEVLYGESEGSTASMISWSNDDLMRGLRVMFDCPDNETIESVTINAVGIRASFRRKERG